MSEIIVLAPELHAAIRRKQNEDLMACVKSYLNMVMSMSDLPETMLVEGAFICASGVVEPQDEGLFGNPWLQALSMKNKVLATEVQEMIENGIIPDLGGLNRTQIRPII